MSAPLEVKVGYDGKLAERGLASLSEAFKTFTDALKSSRDAITSFNAWLDVADKGFSKLTTAAQKAYQATKAVYALAKEGAELAEQRQQFTALAASYGVYADAVIEASRRATTGQVSDADLITNTMAAMRQNVTRDQNELAKLWEIAEVKSDQFGGTVSENFRKIGDAIATGNSRALISLGLLPEAYGKASSKAALLEKQSVTLSSVLKQFGEDVDLAAGGGDSAADAFNRFETSVKNLSNAFSEELGPASQAALEMMASMIDKANEFLRILGVLKQKNPYADLSTNDIRSKKAYLETQLRNAESELSSAGSFKATSGRLIGSGGRDGVFIPGAGSRNLDDLTRKVETLKQKLSQADKALQDNLDGWYASLEKEGDEWGKGINRVATGHNKAGKAAKEHKEAVESLSKAMSDAFASMEEYAKASDIDRLKMAMADLARQSEMFADALGISKLGPIRDSLIEIAKVAGVLSGNIGVGADQIMSKARQTVTSAQNWLSGDLVGDRYSGMLNSAMKSWWSSSSQKSSAESAFGGIESFVTKFYEAMSQPSDGKEEALNKFHDTFKDSVAGSFEAGLNEAILNGGSFFKAFGDALKRQLVSALAQSITSSIFNTSGGSAQGYTSSSGTIYKLIGDGVSSFFGNKTSSSSSSTSNNGLFGNLFKGGSIVKNTVTGLAVGYAVDKLFGQGGLFGSRVVHGAEVPGQAADINTRVRQAADERSQYLGMMGVSQGTYDQLRNLQFWNAGYSWDNSGDGIFSKKTKTYSLDASKANAALEKYAELIAKATAEAASREYEKQFAAIQSPTRALAMTLSDLQDVIKRGTDANGSLNDSAKNAQLQLMQIQADQRSAAVARAGDWFSFMLNNPYANGTDIYNPLSGFWGGDETISEFGLRKYQYPSTPEAQTKLTLSGGSFGKGGTLQGTEISTWLDQVSMVQGLKDQYKKSFDLQSMALDPDQQEAYLKARAEMLNEQMTTSETLSQLAEKKLTDLTLSTEERTAAFEQFQEAQNTYYTAKLEALSIEQQKEAAIKSKQNQLRDDILGTMLTHIGEVSELGGKQVIVLSAGQPDGKALATDLRDAVAGSNPELAKTLTEFIDAVNKPRWN